MNTKHFKDSTVKQISVSIDGFPNRVLLTRFFSERNWSVRGEIYGELRVEMHDGAKTMFQRATALKLAEQYIRTGREFL